MPHAIWKGAISFGLVYVPVALYPASEESGIDFDWLDKRTHDPVGYKRINKRTGKEMKSEDIVKGIKQANGEYVILSEDEIREALREPVTTIVETVRTCLERIPPELAGDLVDSGIVITGGGSLLRGLDRLLVQETQLPVKIAADPTSCVVLGLGRMLDEVDLLKRVAGPA